VHRSTHVDAALPTWTTATAAALLFALCCLPASDRAQTVDESIASFPASASVPQHFRYPTIDVRRDPFVPTDENDQTESEIASNDVPGFTLPPNAGALEGARGLGGAPIVRGIILGLHPSALVEISGRLVLLSAGSPLLGSTVAEIDRSGVLLRDGDRLGFLEPHK